MQILTELLLTTVKVTYSYNKIETESRTANMVHPPMFVHPSLRYGIRACQQPACFNGTWHSVSAESSAAHKQTLPPNNLSSADGAPIQAAAASAAHAGMAARYDHDLQRTTEACHRQNVALLPLDMLSGSRIHMSSACERLTAPTWMGRVRHTLQSRAASGPAACDWRRPSSSSWAFCERMQSRHMSAASQMHVP